MIIIEYKSLFYFKILLELLYWSNVLTEHFSIPYKKNEEDTSF